MVAERVLDIRLLGPIAAERGGDTVSLGGPRQRRRAGPPRPRRRAGRHRRPPRRRRVGRRSAGDRRQHAAELRLAAAPGARRRRPASAGRVPATCSRVGRGAARRAPLRGRRSPTPASALAADPGRALAQLDAGLAEWHGPVLADVADEDWARPAAVRWDELRLEALEARFDALLALGRHGEAVPELERTVDEHPLREGFARPPDGRPLPQRAARPTRCGRTRRTREVLADELGLDPTPELADLQTAILNHDPDLAAPASSWTPPAAAVRRGRRAGRRRRRRRRRRPCRCPARRCAPPAGEFVGRERAARRSCARVWTHDVRRAPATWRSLHGRGRRRQVAARRRSSPPRCTPRARSCCGAGPRRRRSCRSSRWSRPCGPCLRAVSNEARRRVAAERGLLALLLPELEQLVPEAKARAARPERRALPAVRDRRRAAAQPSRRSTRCSSCSTTCSGPTPRR